MEDYLLQLVQLSSEIHAAPHLNHLNVLYRRQSRTGTWHRFFAARRPMQCAGSFFEWGGWS